jgi:hypothetical protein
MGSQIETTHVFSFARGIKHVKAGKLVILAQKVKIGEK